MFGNVKKPLALFLFFLISGPEAAAKSFFSHKKVWIKIPQMPFQDFAAHIQASGSLHISYAEAEFSQARKQAQSFNLKTELAQAQELYLSGEERRAQKAFKEISDKALSADWSAEDRRIILYALLRHAQMEDEPEKRKALLLSASQFALSKILPASYPDYDLFPPPLMEELKIIQEKAAALSPNWKKIFPHHEIILINGQLINKDKKTALPEAFYRISAFSSSHQAWQAHLNLAQLISKKIKTVRLTKGSCAKARLSENLINRPASILPYSSCPAPLAFKTKNKNPAGPFQSSFFGNIKQKNSSHFLNAGAGAMEKPKAARPWLSNAPSWLIIGGGIIAIGLIVSLSSSGKGAGAQKNESPVLF